MGVYVCVYMCVCMYACICVYMCVCVLVGWFLCHVSPWVILCRRHFCFISSLWSKVVICIGIRAISLMNRVFANGPGDRGSIPDRVIPKTQKMILDSTLLKTQHYKVRIKGKVEQSRERNSALPYTSV